MRRKGSGILPNLLGISSEGGLVIALVSLAFTGLLLADLVKGDFALILKISIFLILLMAVYALFKKGRSQMGENEPFNKASILPPDLERFCRDTLKIIKSTLFANSVMIFLLDQGTNLLRLEYKDGGENLTEGDYVEVDEGLPGMVFKTQRPVVEGGIPQGSPAVNYYRAEEQIKSFIGVPLIIEEVIGVLAADSKVRGAFGQEDQKLLESHSSLLTQFMKKLTEREDLDFLRRLVATYHDFCFELKGELTTERLLDILIRMVTAVFRFNRLTISLRTGEDEAVIKRVIGQVDDFPEGFKFNLHAGLTGWVILKNKPLLLADMEKGDFFRPRYSKAEKTNYGLRSFLGVPIACLGKSLGAITLEGKEPDLFKSWDERVLSTLATLTGLGLSG